MKINRWDHEHDRWVRHQEIEFDLGDSFWLNLWAGMVLQATITPDAPLTESIKAAFDIADMMNAERKKYEKEKEA